MKIKKGDKVKVMRGKDAGKTGEVIKVINPKVGINKSVKVVVKDVNIVKKNQKPNPTFNIPGGIIEFEKPIDVSNVMLVEGSKVTRAGLQIDEKTGKKVRISKKSGKEI
ncbi:50S ribosomal protein L24 [Candidatus Dojkabacteria bacterium]|uniref:Large ribosomal subunit protein uL24 n=1 Tax=Candidatus Dojkabacteria bacterium TaxID=2099670 RepID=A0A955RLP9_9BACT|nr:50S ribosomal protein L24 [Candidatus Dojkabacteria bacterium]